MIKLICTRSTCSFDESKLQGNLANMNKLHTIALWIREDDKAAEFDIKFFIMYNHLRMHINMKFPTCIIIKS